MKISYAQNLEDVLLYRALRDDPYRFYVDVGAWDPVGDSVTKMFYDEGWSGINIEPNQFYFKKICESRLRDVNLDCAISDINSTGSFLIDKNSGLSRLKSEIEDDDGDKSIEQVVDVQIRTLTSVLDQYAPKNKISFLKIDVEGWERQVLVSNDWSKYRPRILIIESTEPGSSIESFHKWSDVLVDNDYKFVYFDGLNRYYVDIYAGIDINRFGVQPNVFDDYVRHSDVLLQHAREELSVLKEELIESKNKISKIERELIAIKTSRVFRLANALKSFIGWANGR